MEDWSILVREQAAFTLWTLAGDKKPQRKMISERIGIQQILVLKFCCFEYLKEKRFRMNCFECSNIFKQKSCLNLKFFQLLDV